MPLYLVRHGETDYNREKRFQSTTDVPLNARGVAQAEAVREAFARRGLRFSRAVSSPLSRAFETALIVLAGSDVPLEIEPAFRELSLGEYEGRLEAELRAELGTVFADWRASHYTKAPPGGEDIIRGAQRVRPALDELREPAVRGDVLVVAHQAVLMAAKVALSGRTDIASARSFKQANDQVDVWDAVDNRRLELFSVGAMDGGA